MWESFFRQHLGVKKTITSFSSFRPPALYFVYSDRVNNLEHKFLIAVKIIAQGYNYYFQVRASKEGYTCVFL